MTGAWAIHRSSSGWICCGLSFRHVRERSRDMNANEPGEAPAQSAGDMASAALKAAQAAVALLNKDGPSGPPPAPDVDQGMNDALRAAQEAISQARSVSGPRPADSRSLGDMTEQSGAGSSAAAASGAQRFDLPSFSAKSAEKVPEGIGLLSNVNLNVRIELGRTRMLVEDVLRLGSGSVVELDKLAGDPVDVYVNDRHVAKGEVLVLNDNFCVRINEIVSAVVEPGKR
jgi:flagellar motor switch protein FliN